MLVVARNAPYLRDLEKALHLSRDLACKGPVLVRLPDDSAVKITHRVTVFESGGGKHHVADVVSYPSEFVNWND